MEPVTVGEGSSLSASRTIKAAAGSYLVNALTWSAIAAIIAVLAALVPLLLVLSEFLSEAPGGSSALTSLLCTLGALGALAAIVWCFNKIVALALDSETAHGARVQGIDAQAGSKFFLTPFLVAFVVLVVIAAALQFLFLAMGSAWVFVLLVPVAFAVSTIVIVDTDTERGIVESAKTAWTLIRKRPAFFARCVVPAFVLAALGVAALVVVDIPAVWDEPNVHVGVRLAATFGVFFGLFALVAQPITVLGSFAYRAAARSVHDSDQ